MNYFKKGKGLAVVAVGLLLSLGFGGRAFARISRPMGRACQKRRSIY